MKKFIALLLCAVMCLPLVACNNESGNTETPPVGENTESNVLTNDTTNDDTFATNDDTTNETDSNDFDLCQEWREIASGETLAFDKDGNMHIDGKTCKYEYNSELNIISVFDSQTFNITVAFEDDIYKLKFEVEVYVPAVVYEIFHSAYIEERIPKIINDKTELIPGRAYTTSNGIEFTFVKAEISTENPNGRFLVYISSEQTISISSAEYKYSNRYYDSFSISRDAEKSEANTSCFAGGSREIPDLENDRNEFGFFIISIDGEIYYIPIETFFA